MKYPINQVENAKVRLYNLIRIWQIVNDHKMFNIGIDDNWHCWRTVGNGIIYCIAVIDGKVPEYRF